MDYKRQLNRLTLALTVITALFLTSCRTSLMTTTAKSEAKTESDIEKIYIVDSVFVHDSIYIRESNDTIILERWRTKWRERIVHDTVVERVTDTIRETEYVERIVEKNSSIGKSGWIVAVILFLLIIIQTFIKTLLNKH